MEDRGEKIINLAREMLRSDMVFEPAPMKAKPAISFKILCMATALTAVASSAVTQWADQTHRPLNRYERTELVALVFYTAKTKGISEDTVRREIVEKAGIHSFDDITTEEFDKVRRLLQDKAQ